MGKNIAKLVRGLRFGVLQTWSFDRIWCKLKANAFTITTCQRFTNLEGRLREKLWNFALNNIFDFSKDVANRHNHMYYILLAVKKFITCTYILKLRSNEKQTKSNWP